MNEMLVIVISGIFGILYWELGKSVWRNIKLKIQLDFVSKLEKIETKFLQEKVK